MYITHYKNPCKFWDQNYQPSTAAASPEVRTPPETPTGPELGAKHSPPSWGSTKKNHAAIPQEIHFPPSRGVFPIFLRFQTFFFLVERYHSYLSRNCNLELLRPLHGKKPKKKGPDKKISFTLKSGWLVIFVSHQNHGLSFMPLARGWNQFPLAWFISKRLTSSCSQHSSNCRHKWRVPHEENIGRKNTTKKN